jgi:ABC-2 type transport system ATP-binding protein
MRQGKILLEGKPDELRAKLDGRIIEVHGEPLQLLREIARSDTRVEDAQMFGDRLHLRVQPDSAQAVMENLRVVIPARGGRLSMLRSITPQLEDVFIDLLEGQSALEPA